MHDFQSREAVQYRCPWCHGLMVSGILAGERDDEVSVHLHSLPTCSRYEAMTDGDAAEVLQQVLDERQPSRNVVIRADGGGVILELDGVPEGTVAHGDDVPINVFPGGDAVMRVTHKIELTVADDEDETESLFKTGGEVLLLGFKEAVSGKADLAPAGPLTIPLGGLATVLGCFIKATGEIALTVNGGSAITLKPGFVDDEDANVKADDAKFFFEGTITSLAIVAGSADVTVTWCVWGDPIA